MQRRLAAPFLFSASLSPQNSGSAITDWHFISKSEKKKSWHKWRFKIWDPKKQATNIIGFKSSDKRLSTLKFRAEKIPCLNFSNTSCCGAEFLLHWSENSLHFSSWLVAGCGVESTRHAHGSPTSYTLLCPRASCLPMWHQQFILYQQGWRRALEGALCAALPRQWCHMGNRRISRSPFHCPTNGGAYYVRRRSL